ncbi:palmitoyltransferase ZDHHC22 [Orussus abietinus]|uniref:palmitoyltransferase ZDHHC22 n=1 Tax=Orussus abietinus TaxID=222816 RepID=UPI000625614E|nr:palmitoyltransferase ZDHHC22 [Orussus abietinus]XP_012284832.1 palmitoyltransferase ZDHHC22 [Orussus abietinus]XP_012284833.1 palmitoyltransferase ZDHHC22 [Orussus abietinus]XP_012284834.1 palmitoyltransferase ZDHHC22 [Orussus abietinus]
MKLFNKIAIKLCPALAILFGTIVVFTTLYLSNKISMVFMFFCLQVYLNWYSIYSICKKASTVKVKRSRKEYISNSQFVSIVGNNSSSCTKFWYCEKCMCYTGRPTQHCSCCERCFHFRDHHCFFIGVCILRQNMGNFILICLYTSLASFYSLSVLGPYLHEHLKHFVKPDSTYFNIILNFCFPVALVRQLMSKEDTCIILVTLFDTLVSIGCISLAFGIWKLYACLTGKQRYYLYEGRKQDLKEIFGNYGISNIIFPYNGLIGTRDIGGKSMLKEV